ncbi:NADPH-dependent FMN reductase [Fodinicola feengrottensis]|uniref:NAD(P)H-dependent oxidoreductase n=1 Tax=Fodinicola feengrottensis TaxID=435914 RepID=A0ABN2GZC5_9ACTN|nr:NAD(P)H-dependent oxidoreductase [Fodinicola feengrottensis]
MGAGQPVRVLGIGGSTRPDSTSERALRIAMAAAEEAGLTTEFITGRALILPIYDTEVNVRSGEAAAFVAAVRRADALIVASPGYHGTLSGLMKNALDYVEDTRLDPRPYLDGLPVGCIAVAHGWQATVSTLTSVRTVVHALRGWPSPLGATVNAAAGVFDKTGELIDDTVRFQLETVGVQVAEFALARRLAAQARGESFRERPDRAS